MLPNACTSNLRLKSKIISSSNYYETDCVPLRSRWVGFFADWVVLDDLLGFGRSFNSPTRLYYQLFVILRIEGAIELSLNSPKLYLVLEISMVFETKMIDNMNLT